MRCLHTQILTQNGVKYFPDRHLLIDKRHGRQSNVGCETKEYFNEFVANVLRDNIGTVIFDL